jgi:MFS-type transporter involved in bile tolerance (Atg22 family)
VNLPYSMFFVPVVVVYLFICYEEFRRQFIVEAGIAYINVVYRIYLWWIQRGAHPLLFEVSYRLVKTCFNIIFPNSFLSLSFYHVL